MILCANHASFFLSIAKTPPEMQNTVEVQQPVQYQTSPSQPQYQQIVINHPQNQQVLVSMKTRKKIVYKN